MYEKWGITRGGGRSESESLAGRTKAFKSPYLVVLDQCFDQCLDQDVIIAIDETWPGDCVVST